MKIGCNFYAKALTIGNMQEVNGACKFSGGDSAGRGNPSYGQDVNAAQGLRKLTSSERPNWRAMISL